MSTRLALAVVLVVAFGGWRWVRGAWFRWRHGLGHGLCRYYGGIWLAGRALGASRVPPGPTVYFHRRWPWRRGAERWVYIGRAVHFARRMAQHAAAGKPQREDWGRWSALVFPAWRADDLDDLETDAIYDGNPLTNISRPTPRRLRARP